MRAYKPIETEVYDVLTDVCACLRALQGKFRKERSPLEKFDEAWLKDNKDKDWKDHGKMFESDIAIPSGNIIKPWTDHSKAAYEYGHHKRLPVPTPCIQRIQRTTRTWWILGAKVLPGTMQRGTSATI